MGRGQTFLAAGRSLLQDLRNVFRAHSGEGDQSTKELYTKNLENQIVELKISLKMVEAESNKYQRENQVLKDLLGVNGIPLIPTPTTTDQA